jgi:hypothetical protein
MTIGSGADDEDLGTEYLDTRSPLEGLQRLKARRPGLPAACCFEPLS